MIYKKQKHIFTDIQKPTLHTKSLLHVGKNSHLSDNSSYKIIDKDSFLSILITALFIFLGGSLLLLPGKAQAATRTWDGGCGATITWSCDANWSSDTKPVAGDIVVFNNTSDNNSTVDVGFSGTITTININSGYDGTLSLARSLTATGSFTQASGIFTATGQTLAVNSTFTLSGGTFNVPDTMNFGGTSGSSTLTCNNANFTAVNLSHSGTATKTISTGCSFPLGNNPTINGGISLSGSLSGTGTLSTPTEITFQFNTGGSLSGFSAWTGEANVVIFASVTIDLSFMNNLELNSLSQGSGTFTAPNIMTIDSNSLAFMFIGGTFNAPSDNFTIKGSISIGSSGRVFNHNNGTITFEGTGAFSNDFCGNVTFNKVVLQNLSGDMQFSTDCNLPLGSDPTATFNGAGSILIIGTVSGSGSLVVSGGELQIFAGFVPYNFLGFDSVTTDEFSMFGGTADLSNIDFMDVNGDFTIPSDAGVISPPVLKVGNDFIVTSGGTFTHNNGTVILDGSNQAIVGTTFNNLTKVCATACTLTMPAGSTETILGTLTLQGAVGQLLSLVSSTPGSPWYLDVQGSSNVSYVAVADSQSIGNTIVACFSEDNDGNSDWSFNPSICGSTPTPSPSGTSGSSNSSLSPYGYTVSLADTGSIKDGTVVVGDDMNDDHSGDYHSPTQQSGWWVVIVNTAKWLLPLLILIGLGWWLVVVRRRKSDKAS